MASSATSLLLAAVLLTRAPGDATPPATAAPPQPALDFDFADLSGESHRLSEMRPHPVLLEFWASWCVPCRKGFPFLDDLAARHADDGLRVVAVTLETEEEAVRRFVAGYQVRFLVGRQPSGEAGELYRVSVMPTAILLDGEGRELARFEGGTEKVHREIEGAVEQILSGEGVSQSAGKGQPVPRGNVRAWQRGYLA